MNKEQRCPNSDHPDDCLCDVVVKETTPIANMDFGNDSWFAKEICDHLGLSSPWDDDKMIQFLTAQVMFYEEVLVGLRKAKLDEAEVLRRKSTRSSLLTPEQMREVQEMFVEGATSVGVRVHLKSKYGIDMTPSYASHLRKRTIELVEGES